MLDDELKFAAVFVQGDPGANAHAIALARSEFQLGIGAFEHRAADLGRGVLQGEVPVSRARCGEIADFPLNPNKVKMALKQHFGLMVKFADGKSGLVR